MKTITAILMFPLVAVATLQAQQEPERPRPRAGGYAGYNRNLHDAEFTKLPGVPGCCPRYESGQGAGISIGALYDLPVSSLQWFQLRAGYSSHGATLTTVEQTSIISNGQQATGSFEHRIDATLSNIGIEPIVALRIVPDLSLYAGLRAGYVMSRSFSQQELIIQPEGTGTFIDSNGRDSKKRTRNEFSGTIPDASELYVALLGGLSYDLPLDRNGTLVASPEIFYSIGLTPVSNDISWQASALRAGISFRYTLPQVSEDMAAGGLDVAQTDAVDPLAGAHAPMLSATIAAAGVDASGVEHQGASFLVEESISSRMTPLLSYLFFDDVSTQIPERYSRLARGQAPAFTIASLHTSPTLATYHHLLNIVGRRLTEYPEAIITLTGCNSGIGKEAGNSSLSRRRAESLRDYLVSVWDISGDRISIAVRDLPANPATPLSDAEKIEENRRVEITSSFWQILEPVQTADTLRTITAPIIRFKPSVVAETGVAGWTIVAEQRGRELRRFESQSSETEMIDWNLQTEQHGNLPVVNESVVYTLVVQDLSARQVSSPAGIIAIERTVRQGREVERVGDMEIERFSLLLFDFDNADLTADNRRIAEQIKACIRPGSTVTINGYTDRTGAVVRNLALSEQRARTVGKIPGGGIRIDGIGEDTLLHDNDLPEGRAYCRTVEIIVATPVR